MVYIKDIEGYKIMGWCLDLYFTFHMSYETYIIFFKSENRAFKKIMCIHPEICHEEP